MDPGFALAGAVVGFLIGMTGVGGGSLMAPILILFFGFNPSVAVGTDLWFAALTKMCGGLVHRKVGSPDWKIVQNLALGSVPAVAITLGWLNIYHQGKLESDFLMKAIAAMLILTAFLGPMKGRLHAPLVRFRQRMGPSLRQQQFVATLLGGAFVGVLVTLTSIGAGALVAVLLMLIYPIRLGAKSVISTDIMHAIPLALVAAIGHSFLGNVDWGLLVQLLIGSIPGIVLGSLAASRTNDKVMAYLLSAVLLVTGIKLMTA